MTNRIVWKFFGASVILTFIAVFVLNFFVGVMLQKNFQQKFSQRLRSNALLLGNILEEDLLQRRPDQLQQHAQELSKELGLQITILDDTGQLLASSTTAPAANNRYAEQPEIRDALKYGFGQSTQLDEQTGRILKHVAVKVERSGRPLGVVRLSVPLAELQLEVQLIYRVVLLGAAAAIVLGVIAAYFLSRRISSPIRQMQRTAERIARGDLSQRISIKSQDELGELAKALNTMADELQQKMQHLERMNRIRTDFVANVSHELKTPLTLIKGYVETLEDRALEDPVKVRRFVRIIREHADRLGNIVEDLLTLSELEQSHGRIQKQPFDLKKLIEDVILGFGHAIEDKHHRLEIIAQGDNFEISADRDKIEQLFVNLIDNAIKYTNEHGQITIRLDGRAEEICVSVQDNGIGIPRKDLDRVFERFYRVDKARSRRLGGTGLGLGIAKHIVLAHHGDIRLESQLGRGTTVHVTLPRN